MVGEPTKMKKHRDAFLDSLTDEEMEIHKKQVEKGVWGEAMKSLKSKMKRRG